MWWLDRAKPTYSDAGNEAGGCDAPVTSFKQVGYELVHHGEGRWNGVAIASRCGIGGVITNFGEPLRPTQTSETGDDEPLAEARYQCQMRRIRVGLYAPNGRQIDSPFYEGSSRGSAGWLAGSTRPLPEYISRHRRRFQCRTGRRCVGSSGLSVDARRSASGRRWRCRAQDSSMRIDYIIRNQGGTHGGTTVPVVYKKFRHAHRPSIGDDLTNTPRDLLKSIAKRGKANRYPRITHRWSSTSTTQAIRRRWASAESRIAARSRKQE